MNSVIAIWNQIVNDKKNKGIVRMTPTNKETHFLVSHNDQLANKSLTLSEML